MVQFHERIPYLIPWTSPVGDKWHAIVVPGNGCQGQMKREIFFYHPDGTCSGGTENPDPMTITEVTRFAIEKIRERAGWGKFGPFGWGGKASGNYRIGEPWKPTVRWSGGK